ncbi:MULTISPECIES: ribonuclease P protein component [Bacteroides]|uniref:ribonuclease P protein component n=1 Tax=Bacteroides TaxID=816 RepID=UPI000C778469|nr:MULTISPECIES: ribonuclease P protein component [Bacteroides]RGM49998.1 ribonuclease P protein component [Bacteroides sp. OM08-11]
MANTLRKPERLNRKKVIEKMFAGGSRSFSVFPLRVVYLPVGELDAPVSILVSVSKRHFKRAVKRNRMKRRIREAYRVNKQELLNVLAQKQIRLAVAFIYLSDDLVAFSVIEERMKTALARIAEKILTIEKEEVVETVATAEAIAMGAEETQSVQEP